MQGISMSESRLRHAIGALAGALLDWTRRKGGSVALAGRKMVEEPFGDTTRNNFSPKNHVEDNPPTPPRRAIPPWWRYKEFPVGLG
jgi:hypothetical protein